MIFYAIVSSAGFARSRLSRNCYRPISLFKKQWTLQSPKKMAQKDVRHFGGNPHGESSSSCLNQVKRDNVWSHGHSVGRRHWRKRCFRRWLNNHTPEKCKYKDSECFNCHLWGHSPKWSLFLPIKTQISRLKQLIVFFNLLYKWLSFVLSNVTLIASLWASSFLRCLQTSVVIYTIHWSNIVWIISKINLL